jgi:hypothetical protein
LRGRRFLKCGDTLDNVVSNPPFDIFRPFAERALKLARFKVAMIWLVRTLPAARWLQDTPLARILLLTPRPSMPPGHVIARGEKPGGGKQDFCWLIWDHAHSGPCIDRLAASRRGVEVTARATFTEAALRRAIRAAEKAGYRVGGVKPDGTVLVYSGEDRPENLSIVPAQEEATGGTSWDDR